MTYFKTATQGASWIIFLRGGIRAATIIKLIVLARILTPAQFGEFGIAMIVLGLLEIFTETGINVFLMQEKDDPEKYLNTAWIISLIRGVLISSIVLFTASLVANFFRVPHVINLLSLVSVVPLIRGFINPMCIKFQKNLEFNKEVFYRLSITIVELITTLILAFYTRSVFSFGFGILLSSIFETVLSWILIKPTPIFSWDQLQIKQILSRGKWITSMGVLDYLYTQSDNVAVGRLLDQTSLGIYQNAYKLSALPLTEVGDVFYKVTFPIFVKLTDQPQRLKTAAIKSAVILAGVLFVFSVVLFWAAEPIVGLLGPAWKSAVPVVKALAFLGFFRGMSLSFNPLLMALKHQQKVVIIGLFSTLGLLVTIVPFVLQWGITGAAYSAMLGAMISIIPAIYFVWKVLYV